MLFLNRRSVISSCFGRRPQSLVGVTLLIGTAVALLCCRRLSSSSMNALAPPPPMNHDLHHLRRSRRLQSYIDDLTDPLIEPSISPCQDVDEIPLIALVTSAPHRFEQRHAIRATWGREQPTYFFLGLPGLNIDEQLVDNYVEAKQHSDIIVGDFVDAYHNLTLKTALMLRWSLRRCPRAEFVLKTDDDVLVNPWTLDQVLRDNGRAELLGYKKNNSVPHRDAYNKWYLPRWLYPQDSIPEYLSGTAYLIRGEYLPKVYEEAFNVPLINLEDVFFTYLVAKRSLGLTLTHDSRLSPYQPLVPVECAYWNLATVHSLKPEDMLRIWPKVKSLAQDYQDNNEVCQFYTKYLNSESLLY